MKRWFVLDVVASIPWDLIALTTKVQS
jgi:hypothetical protein